MRIQTASLAALGAAALVTLAPAAAADPADSPPAPDPAVVATETPVASAEDGGVPHLSSLDNLPPGTSEAPTVPESRGVSYLRDLWHAVQTQEVSGADALLLLTQRPMDPASASPPPVLAPLPPPTAPAPAPVP